MGPYVWRELPCCTFLKLWSGFKINLKKNTILPVEGDIILAKYFLKYDLLHARGKKNVLRFLCVNWPQFENYFQGTKNVSIEMVILMQYWKP